MSRSRVLGVGGVVTLAALQIWAGCAASDSGSGGGGGTGSGGTGGSSASGGTGGIDGSSGSGGDGGIGNTGAVDSGSDGNLTPDSSCAQFQVEAKQAPAALLIVLDRSTSMAEAGKWTAAQLAIVQAIDSNAFDNLSLGMLVYPAGDVPGPACIMGFPVSCGVSALPQVPLADTGTAKSNTPGVRQQIYGWLSSNQPNGTATPGYDALAAAIAGIGMYSLPAGGIRAVLLISDGGFTCTSLSNPQRPAFPDSLGCLDWEHPDNVVQLLDAAYDDATTPVRTFVIGVPGSDTTPTDPEAPPYYMRRAMSAFAKAGSPTSVPAGCDGTFQQNQPDPAVPCHFDLTQGNFNAQALGDAIADIRGQVLGCIYQLPEPAPGETIDKGKVNVNVTIDGTTQTIPQRSDPNDTCESSPCWDYDDKDQIVLLGKACEDLKTATSSKVEILVGCTTIVK